MRESVRQRNMQISYRSGTLLRCCAVLLIGSTGCAERSSRDHALISAVIVDDIRALRDSAEAGEHAGLGASAPDSGQRIQEATWVAWWYTARSNRVSLPPDVLARFSRHFDTRHPPSDPFPSVPDHYSVVDAKVQEDTLLVAEIGPSYSRCTYTFVRRGEGWMLVPERTAACSIS
jgi:hypothetical protein